MSFEGMEPLSLVEESELSEQQATKKISRVPRVVAGVLCAVALVSVFFFGRWSRTPETIQNEEPVGEKTSAGNEILEMASSQCQNWCKKDTDASSFCWKCERFSDACGGCEECANYKDNCPPAGCQDWCKKDTDANSFCWKCESYTDACGGCEECAEDKCAPAECKHWCAGSFEKKSVEAVCKQKQCAGCDRCPPPAVIKDAVNFVCEEGKNYMGEAKEWPQGDNDGKAWTREQCANKCDAQTGCRAYILGHDGRCWLKSNIGIVEHNKPSLACKKTNYEPEGFSCEHGVNYVGQTKEAHHGGTTSMAACAKKCKEADWCHVYVYHQISQNCWIKDKVGRTDHGQRGTESCRDRTVTYSW